jgi:protein-S-isoprenylcysteine O-methyltransferase Ste14
VTGEIGERHGGLIGRIPLPVRVAFYAVVFLGGVGVALPMLADRVVGIALPALMTCAAARSAGWALVALFLAGYLACTVWLTSRGRGAYVEFDPPTRLVVGGPYRACRNPVALCALGMVLGEALAFSSLGVALFFVVAATVAHMQVVLLEEPLLRRRFGAAYEAFVTSTPRWVPGVPRRDDRPAAPR